MTRLRTRPARRPARVPFLLAPVVGLLALAGTPALAEPPPAGNLVANPSFERDPQANWEGYRSSFSQLVLAPGEAPDGAAAVQVVAGPNVDAVQGYALDDMAASGGTAVPAGTQFVASAYLRAASAQSIGKLGKVWVRERDANDDLIEHLEGQVVLTGAFQQATTPVYTTRRAGSQVDVYVAQNPAAPGDAFAADLVTLTRNLPPAGDLTVSDASPKVGDSVTFGSAQVKDPEGVGVASRAWDLTGNGAFSDGTEPTASRRFTQVGTYTVRLRAADAAGATSVLSRTVTVTVDGVAPLPGAPGAPAGRARITGFSVRTVGRVSIASFRLSAPAKVSAVLQRRRDGRAGYARVRAIAGKRMAAGGRAIRLGRDLKPGRYRLRFVLRPAAGAPVVVAKFFVIRAR